MHWQISNASARGSAVGGTIEVFPAHPEQPARLQLLANAEPYWAVAAVRPLPEYQAIPEEIYARENDLICRYLQSDRAPFAFQLDWQMLPPSGPFELGAELWLSVQTNLLDTQPLLEITSSSLGTACWQVYSHQQLSDISLDDDAPQRGPAALVCQFQNPSGDYVSGVWLIESTDQRHAKLCSDGAHNATEPDPGVCSQAARIHLFGHFMEKGVIRRGRMRFLLAARQIQQEDICAAYNALSHSPLPLTA